MGRFAASIDAQTLQTGIIYKLSIESIEGEIPVERCRKLKSVRGQCKRAAKPAESVEICKPIVDYHPLC